MSTQKRSSFPFSEDHSKTIGVLYTGYADKRNPVTGSYKKRFVVLTHDAIHWFVRTDQDDLFGEERGRVGLGSIVSVRILDENATTYEILGQDKTKRLFRLNSPAHCEEWVSAIRSAIKLYSKSKGSSSGSHQSHSHHEETGGQMDEVTVLLVSLCTKAAETVIARVPGWGRLVNVSNVCEQDDLLISLSNGGSVTLSADLLERKCDEVDFEVAVQAVTLASSLRISVQSAVSAGGRLVPEKNSSGRGAAAPNSANGLVEWVRDVSFALQEAVRDRKHAPRLVLSCMLILVAILSAPGVSAESSLLFVFALLLAAHSVYDVLRTTSPAAIAASSFAFTSSRDGGKDHSSRGSLRQAAAAGRDYVLVIHGHAFTSPDAPVDPPEDQISQRFIDGCEGDIKEARRRWDITLQWRATERVDAVLTEPQPFFFTIKSLVSHFHAGHGRNGNTIYYERTDTGAMENLQARGLTVDQLARHWLFVTEYQWNILLKGDDMAKTITVMDLEKFGMNALQGFCLEYTKKTIGWANLHYPERSLVIYAVNAPWYCSLLWKVIKPWIHPNTQKKVRILSRRETLAGMQEHIDISQIPEYYGGKLRYEKPPGFDSLVPGGAQNADNDSCRHFSPQSLAMFEYVKKLNAQIEVGASSSPVSTSKQPPGIRGEHQSSGSGSVSIQGSDSGSSKKSSAVPVPSYESRSNNGPVSSSSRPVYVSTQSRVKDPRSAAALDLVGEDAWSVCSADTSLSSSTKR